MQLLNISPGGIILQVDTSLITYVIFEQYIITLLGYTCVWHNGTT